MGLIENLARRGRADALEAGDIVVLIGADAPGWLGQSMYLREVMGREEGAPPPVDLAAEQRHGDFVRGLIGDGLVIACHDLSDGGLGCAAAEMALAGDVGVALGYQGEEADTAFVFGEAQARYLIGLKPAQLGEFETRARAAGVAFLIVGEAGGRDVSYLGASGAVERIGLTELRRLHEAWLPSYMEGR